MNYTATPFSIYSADADLLGTLLVLQVVSFLGVRISDQPGVAGRDGKWSGLI